MRTTPTPRLRFFLPLRNRHHQTPSSYNERQPLLDHQQKQKMTIWTAAAACISGLGGLLFGMLCVCVIPCNEIISTNTQQVLTWALWAACWLRLHSKPILVLTPMTRYGKLISMATLWPSYKSDACLEVLPPRWQQVYLSAQVCVWMTAWCES